jgi:hypothetical protein
MDERLTEEGRHRHFYFSAHSTKGAVASKATSTGDSIQAIFKQGNWSNESNFSKFYRAAVRWLRPDGGRFSLIMRLGRMLSSFVDYFLSLPLDIAC